MFSVYLRFWPKLKRKKVFPSVHFEEKPTLHGWVDFWVVCLIPSIFGVFGYGFEDEFVR